MAHQLTAADVAAIEFERTQFRPGYEIEEVDAFMAAIVAALGKGQPLGVILDRAEFATTARFQEGYEQADVDELVALLRRRESAAPVRRGGRRAATDLQRRSRADRPSSMHHEPEPSTSTIVGSMSEAAPTEYEDIMLDLGAPLPAGSTPDPGSKPDPVPEPDRAPPFKPKHAPAAQPVQSWQPEPEPVSRSAPDVVPWWQSPEAQSWQVEPVQSWQPEPDAVQMWKADTDQVIQAPAAVEPEPQPVIQQQDWENTTEPEVQGSAAGPSFVLEESELQGPAIVVDMTPEEVDAVRFTTTRFRSPYDMGAVDDFLDMLAQILREGEDPSPLLSQASFPPAARTGYRRKEVDQFLSRLMSVE